MARQLSPPPSPCDAIADPAPSKNGQNPSTTAGIVPDWRSRCPTLQLCHSALLHRRRLLQEGGRRRLQHRHPPPTFCADDQLDSAEVWDTHVHSSLQFMGSPAIKTSRWTPPSASAALQFADSNDGSATPRRACDDPPLRRPQTSARSFERHCNPTSPRRTIREVGEPIPDHLRASLALGTPSCGACHTVTSTSRSPSG